MSPPATGQRLDPEEVLARVGPELARRRDLEELVARLPEMLDRLAARYQEMAPVEVR